MNENDIYVPQVGVDMDDATLARFDRASRHPYEGECPICAEWWVLMGPEQ